MLNRTESMITNGKLIGANVDTDAYHRTDKKRGDKDYPIGRSSLMLFAECPHKWINGYDRKESKATDWGTLMDCLILTPQDFEKRFVVAPATYPELGMKCPKCGSITDAKSCRKCKVDRAQVSVQKPWNWSAEWCKSWMEEQTPRICITEEQYLEAKDAKHSVDDSEPMVAVSISQKQVYLVAEWHDKSTGLEIPLKTLIDLVPSLDHATYGHCLADFKTSFTANGERWSKVAAEHNYHVQAALSLDIYENATGEGRDSWLNVVQENFAPWEVADPIPMLSQEFINEGRKAYRAALAKYCECLSSGEWPSYPTGNLVIAPFQIVDPPPWLAMQQMQRHSFDTKPQPAFQSEMPS